MALRELRNWASVCVLGLSGVATSAHAESDCEWLDVGTTRFLRADCETDQTLFVPDGFTLDGRGHRLTAVDPPDGAFSGAVVQNAGSRASVRRLVIDAGDLTPVCHPATPVDTRVRAILLQDADGAIVENRIVAINQGPSGCQEGDGIEVRASRPVEVWISANRIQNFQKTGIALFGSVDASVYLNRIEGEGPVAYIAQNGIQLSGDISGNLKLNHVSGVSYTGTESSATGILLINVENPLELSLNRVEDTGVGVRITASSDIRLIGNTIRRSTYDGVAIDGRNGLAQRNRLIGNFISDSGGVGIDLFGIGTRLNLVRFNAIDRSLLGALQEALDAGENDLRWNGTLAEILAQGGELPAP
jgi:parallel beta-helix repeat protein